MIDTADLTMALSQIADLLELAVTEPLRAADELDGWASQLKDVADALRASVKDDGAPKDSGGIGERVMMRVVGPEGQEKQFIDTGRN